MNYDYEKLFCEELQELPYEVYEEYQEWILYINKPLPWVIGNYHVERNELTNTMHEEYNNLLTKFRNTKDYEQEHTKLQLFKMNRLWYEIATLNEQEENLEKEFEQLIHGLTKEERKALGIE